MNLIGIKLIPKIKIKEKHRISFSYGKTLNDLAELNYNNCEEKLNEAAW